MELIDTGKIEFSEMASYIIIAIWAIVIMLGAIVALNNNHDNNDEDQIQP